MNVIGWEDEFNLAVVYPLKGILNVGSSDNDLLRRRFDAEFDFGFDG